MDVPKQRRFTTVLADISADGRDLPKSSPPPQARRPSLAIVESSLFGSDSESSSDDEDISPSLSTALQRIQQLEIQLQQQNDIQTQQLYHERQTFQSKISSLSNVLLDYEERLDNANERDHEISSLLDSRAVNLVEHDFSDEESDTDHKNNESNPKSNHQTNQVHQQSIDIAVANAVAEEHQRMLQHNEFHIETIQEAHALEIKKTISKLKQEMVTNSLRNDHKSSLVLEKLKKSEQEAIESNAKLQNVVDEVKQQVNEERERHQRVMQESRSEKEEMYLEEQKRKDTEHQNIISDQLIQHENVIVTLNMKHTMHLQSMQQQHDQHMSTTYSEWRDQHEQELQLMATQHESSLFNLIEDHENRLEANVKACNIKLEQLNAKHIQDIVLKNQKNEEMNNKYEKKHRLEIEQQEEQHQKKMKNMQEKHQNEITEMETAMRQKHETSQKELISKHIQNNVTNQEKYMMQIETHQQTIQKQKAEHIRIKNTYEQKIKQSTEAFNTISIQHQQQLDLQNITKLEHEKIINELHTSATDQRTKAAQMLVDEKNKHLDQMETCKDNHAKEIATIEHNSTSIRSTSLTNLRLQHEKELLMLTTNQKKQEEKNVVRHHAAYVLQRWARETVQRRQTTATYATLLSLSKTLAMEVTTVASLVEEMEKERNALTLSISTINAEHAIALNEVYEEVEEEVNRRVEEENERVEEENENKEIETQKKMIAIAKEHQLKWKEEEEVRVQLIKNKHDNQINKMATKIDDINTNHRIYVATLQKEKHIEISNIMDTQKKQRSNMMQTFKTQEAAAIATAISLVTIKCQKNKDAEIKSYILKKEEQNKQERITWKKSHEKELTSIKVAYDIKLSNANEAHAFSTTRMQQMHDTQVSELKNEITQTLDNGRAVQEKELKEMENKMQQEMKEQKDLDLNFLNNTITIHQQEMKQLKQTMNNDRWARQNEKQALTQKMTSEHTETIKHMMNDIQHQLDQQRHHLESEYKNTKKTHHKEIKQQQEKHTKELNQIKVKHQQEITIEKKKQQKLTEQHNVALEAMLNQNIEKIQKLEQINQDHQKDLENIQQQHEEDQDKLIQLNAHNQHHQQNVLQEKDILLDNMTQKIENLIKNHKKTNSLLTKKYEALQQKQEQSVKYKTDAEEKLQLMKEEHKEQLRVLQEEANAHLITTKSLLEKKRVTEITEEQQKYFTLQEDYNNKELEMKKERSETIRHIERLKHEKEEVVNNARVKWKEEAALSHKKQNVSKTEEIDEIEKIKNKEINQLKNQNAKRINVLNEMLMAEQARSQTKIEQLRSDIDNERKDDQLIITKMKQEVTDTIINVKNKLNKKYQNEISKLNKEIEELRSMNISIRNNNITEMNNMTREKSEQFEINILRMTTKHNQVVLSMENLLEKKTLSIEKERNDFENFMIETRQNHLVELDTLAVQLSTKHQLQMKKMAERMQQNNVQTTITNETATENVQEIKNNYNIQLEAMTEKLNGVLTRNKRINLELTESQKQLVTATTNYKDTFQLLREARLQISQSDRTLHQAVDKCRRQCHVETQKLLAGQGKRMRNNYSPSAFAAKKKNAKERAEKMKQDRAMMASKHLTFSPKLIPRSKLSPKMKRSVSAQRSRQSTSGSTIGSSKKSKDRTHSRIGKTSTNIEKKKKNEKRKLTGVQGVQGVEGVKKESDFVLDSLPPSPPPTPPTPPPLKKPFSAASRRNTYFDKSTISGSSSTVTQLKIDTVMQEDNNNDSNDTKDSRLSPNAIRILSLSREKKKRTTLDVQLALLSGSKINMASKMLRRKLKSDDLAIDFVDLFFECDNEISYEKFQKMVRHNGKISVRTISDQDVREVFERFNQNDATKKTISFTQLMDWMENEEDVVF